MTIRACWVVLGIGRTTDEREIKRAYARALKATRPEDDPEGFQRLRTAYEWALQDAREGHLYEYDDDEGGHDEALAVEAPQAMSQPEWAGQNASAHEHDAPAMRVTTVTDEAPDTCPHGDDETPAIHDAAHEARRIFVALIPQLASTPVARLEQAARSDALLNFDVRDHFEACAAEYGASEACPEHVRAALVEHFKWDEDASHIRAKAPWAADTLLGRWRAAASHDYFRQFVKTDDVVRHLMADRVPGFVARTCDAGFMERMRAVMETIRWQHPDLLEYRLNQDVFQAWEARVAAKRYYYQTAIWSFITGFAVWIALAYSFDFDSLAEGWPLASFLGLQAASFAGIALITFRPPTALYERLERHRDEHLAERLHNARHNAWLRFGWVGLFAIASLGLFIPSPSASTQQLVGLGVGASLACAIFVHWNTLGWKAIAVVMLASLLLAAGLGTPGVFDAFPYETLIGVAAVPAIMGLVGGENLCRRLGLKDEHVRNIRFAWLTAAINLFIFAAIADKASLGLELACLALTLSGLLLSRMSLSWRLVWPLIVIGNVFGRGGFGAQFASRAAMLMGCVIVVGIFMVINMYRADEAQNQFS